MVHVQGKYYDQTLYEPYPLIQSEIPEFNLLKALNNGLLPITVSESFLASIFALDKEVNKSLTEQLTLKTVEKKYWAIVRGYTPDEQLIDYALYKDNGTLQEAQTMIKTLAKVEIDIPSGKHSTSRYSFVEAFPLTGRMHQIRKHMAHILHPIIGDRPHGCNKQNKIWLEKFKINTMLLHAQKLVFTHPVSNEKVELTAHLQEEFLRAAGIMGFYIDKKNGVSVGNK